MGWTAIRRWRYAHWDAGQEEAGSPASQGTPLPEGFPARDLLLAAGYTTLERVQAATDEELLAIQGIGRRLLGKIRDALR